MGGTKKGYTVLVVQKGILNKVLNKVGIGTELSCKDISEFPTPPPPPR